jgi:hypothetical protein
VMLKTNVGNLAQLLQLKTIKVTRFLTLSIYCADVSSM